MSQVPPSTEQAVERAMRRIKAAWPAQRWTTDSEREYRGQLTWLRDPHAITHAVNTLIRATTDRFTPPIGAFINAAQDDMARRDTNHKRHPSDLRFLQAQPDPRDPPGTVRWIVVNPDGSRHPRGAVAVDDINTSHPHNEPA